MTYIIGTFNQEIEMLPLKCGKWKLGGTKLCKWKLGGTKLCKWKLGGTKLWKVEIVESGN